MRVPFRQGLISFQKVGATPTFLQLSQTPGFVAQVVDPTPIVATFAQGDSDYLMIFDTGVSQAWGPLVGGNNYLFWDIDRFTGQVSRGITLLEPIVSSVQPTNPVNGQHWFDLNQKKMKVWKSSTGAWAEVIRLFAGVVNGSTITPRNEGSQVNLNTPITAGYIQLDTLLKPLRKSNGEFLTDKDASYVRNTSNTSGVLVQPSSRISTVKAAETIPRMSLVYFSGPDSVRLASSNPALMPARIPVGLVTETLNVGDQGNLLTGGEVSFDGWDWSAHPGAALYCTSSGQITTDRPAGLMAYRIGFVKNANTIIFNVDAETQPQVYTAEVGQVIIAGTSPVQISDVINQIGERIVTITVPEATPFASGLMPASTFATIASIDTRVLQNSADILSLQNTKANLSHTHVIGDVIGLQSSLDTKAPISHNHVAANITDLQPLLDAKANLNHNHIVTQVSGLQDALNQKAFTNHLNSFDEVYQEVQRVEGESDFGVGMSLTEFLTTKSNTGHTHSISQVSGLQAALNDKANTLHTHVIADVVGLQAELNLRALTSHTHVISDVSGLQLALNDKASINHTHVIADVVGLQSALTAKADSVHTHVAADVTDFSEAVDDRVSALLQPGDNITLAYDDVLNTLTISSTGGGASLAAGNLIDPDLFTAGSIGVQYITINTFEIQENVTMGVDVPSVIDGGNNTIIGSRAAQGFNTGNNNTIIGHAAGRAMTSGSNNILIGRAAGRQQVLDAGGSLTGTLIINDESYRDPATYLPFISGIMDPDFSSLTLQGDLYLINPDNSMRMEIRQTDNTIIAESLDLRTRSVDAGNAGDVYIRSGNGGYDFGDKAGNIVLEAGTDESSFYGNTGGSIQLITGSQERVTISDVGELKIDRKTGRAGQVLVSRGAGQTPEWREQSEVVQTQTLEFYTFDTLVFTNDWYTVPSVNPWIVPTSQSNIQTGRLFAFDPATGIFSVRKKGTYRITVNALIQPFANFNQPGEDARFPTNKMVYGVRARAISPYLTFISQQTRSENWVPGFATGDQSDESLEAVSISYSADFTTGISVFDLPNTGKDFSLDFRANTFEPPANSGFFVRTVVEVTRLGPEIDGNIIIKEDFDVDSTPITDLKTIDLYATPLRWYSFRGAASDLIAIDGDLRGVSSGETLADAVLNYQIPEPAYRIDVEFYLDVDFTFPNGQGLVVYAGVQPQDAINNPDVVTADLGQNMVAFEVRPNTNDPDNLPGWAVTSSRGIDFEGGTVLDNPTPLKPGLHKMSIVRQGSGRYQFFLDDAFLTSGIESGAGWDYSGAIGVGILQEELASNLITITDVTVIRLPFIGE